MWASKFYGSWDYWDLYDKVTFDGINKLIIVNHGVANLDIGQDVYSAWKRWKLLRDYGKYEPAMSSVGGDPTGPGTALGVTYFLENEWKMRSWEGNHAITLVGNLYSRDLSDPFVPTLSPWNIVVTIFRSNLVDLIRVLQAAELEYQQIAGAVWEHKIKPPESAKDVLVATKQEVDTTKEALDRAERKIDDAQALIISK